MKLCRNFSVKSFSVALVAVSVTSAVGLAGQVACWSLYAARGSRPILTFTSVSNTKIADVKFNDPKTEVKFSLDQMVSGKLNTSNHSPYKGTFDYLFAAPNTRLILPGNLTPEGLASAVLQAGADPRQNAVLVYPPSVPGNFLYDRMHCVAK